MKKGKSYPLVEVTWVDSSGTPGWQTEPATEPLTCWSAGYLVHRSKRSIVVALSCSSEHSNSSFGDTVTLPASVVQRIRRLK